MSESGENWEFSIMLDSDEVLTVGEGVPSLSGEVSAGVSTSSTVCWVHVCVSVISIVRSLAIPGGSLL